MFLSTQRTVFASFAALACSAAMAQAPVNVTRPPAEVAPLAATGPAGANAQNRVDQRTFQHGGAPANPAAGDGRGKPVAEINPAESGGRAAAAAEQRVAARLMDSNGDGMVSRSEWDAYHATAWSSMEPTPAGVSTADMDRHNRSPKVHVQ